MAKNIKKIAAGLGANVVTQVPDTGAGAFGAARLAQVVAAIQARLVPGQGLRPGRPTDASWVRHPKVPMSDATRHQLDVLAQRFSTNGRKISPMQIAAQIIEDALTGLSERLATEDPAPGADNPLNLGKQLTSGLKSHMILPGMKPSMTIHLSKELEQFIHDAVSMGLNAREDDVIRDAVTRLKQAMPDAAASPAKRAKRPKPADKATKNPLTIEELHQPMAARGLITLPDTAADFDDPDDKPIAIKGAPLSETVIREPGEMALLTAAASGCCERSRRIRGCRGHGERSPHRSGTCTRAPRGRARLSSSSSPERPDRS